MKIMKMRRLSHTFSFFYADVKDGRMDEWTDVTKDFGYFLQKCHRRMDGPTDHRPMNGNALVKSGEIDYFK